MFPFSLENDVNKVEKASDKHGKPSRLAKQSNLENDEQNNSTTDKNKTVEPSSKSDIKVENDNSPSIVQENKNSTSTTTYPVSLKINFKN